jgi:flagellar motor protein MotB
MPRNRLEVLGREQSQPIDTSDQTDPANRRVLVVNLGL